MAIFTRKVRDLIDRAGRKNCSGHGLEQNHDFIIIAGVNRIIQILQDANANAITNQLDQIASISICYKLLHQFGRRIRRVVIDMDDAKILIALVITSCARLSAIRGPSDFYHRLFKSCFSHFDFIVSTASIRCTRVFNTLIRA